MRLIRTNSEHKLFKDLVSLLDADLAIRDGEDTDFYQQFNTIDQLKHVVLAMEDDVTVACGAMKHFEPKVVEIKRMFTAPKSRGKGAASLVLSELESWAAELNYERCILETGLKQPEAIALYQKNGYKLIPNYAQYKDVENSRCFEKRI